MHDRHRHQPGNPASMTPLRSFADQLSTRHWKLLFISMLVLLHIASVRGADDWWARAIMLAHCGLFIIWQPFLQGSHRLHWSGLALIVGASAAILYGLNWWSLGLWVAMLAGLVGGKVFVFHQRWIRLFHLLVLAYLVAILLLWIVPNGFPAARIESVVSSFAVWGLPALFVAMLVLPVERDHAELQIVDLFYSTLIFLLLVVLVLGSFTFMTLGQVPYGIAVTYMAITLGTVLIFLSLIWNPRGGFAGLSVFFSRYLLSVGLPFEHWLHFLAELSRNETEPIDFLRKAAQGLSRLQWVSGGTWTVGTETGDFGTRTDYSVAYSAADFDLTIYSRLRPSPSLVWHFNVLGLLLTQFHVAKQREMKLRHQSYVQAVHETGARLTHDVKNLLQSLNVLCSAATQEGGDSAAFHAMVRRHLPIVTQRLEKTLEKLQRPTEETGRYMQSDAWWDQIQRTFVHPAVQFEATGLDRPGPIPRDLFESAADNLINNALEKRRTDPTVQVAVRLDCGEEMRFSVTDTGKPVRPEIERGLFEGPVPSETGYGIALYQMFRQAHAQGFRVRLAENREGCVCFELSPQ